MLHYQRGEFDFLNKYSLARNLFRSVSMWESCDEVSDCHSSLKPRSRQLQHQVSSSYVVVHCHQYHQKLQKHYREWELCCWDWECRWLSLGVIHDVPATQGASLTGSVLCSSCLMSDSSAAAADSNTVHTYRWYMSQSVGHWSMWPSDYKDVRCYTSWPIKLCIQHL